MADEAGKQDGAADAGAGSGAGSADAGVQKDTVSREEFNKVVKQRDEYKGKLKEAEPLVAEGKKALDANKTASEKLAELQAENAKKDAALAQERKKNALRLEAVKAGIDPDAAERLADASAIKDDGSGAAEALAAVAKKYPGLVETRGPGRTPGPGAAGAGGGNTIKQADLSRLAETDFAAFSKMQTSIAKGEVTVT